MSATNAASDAASSSAAAAVLTTSAAAVVPSAAPTSVTTLSPSGIVVTVAVDPASSNASTITQPQAGAGPPAGVPAPSTSAAVPTGPRSPPAGRQTVRSGMGRNIRLGAPRTNPAIIEDTTSLRVTGGAVMHEGLPYRSLRNNNLRGPIQGGGPLNPASTTPLGTPGTGISLPIVPDQTTNPVPAPTNPITPPAPRLRADRNTRVDTKKKDVIISTGGIHRNQGRYVDKIVGGKQKYVLDTDWHLPAYDMATEFATLTPAERKAYWARCHVEFTINVGSPAMAADILAIVGHMDSLGAEFSENLANFFINMNFPDQQLRPANQKISAVPSINALAPLVSKLATFKSTRFVVVTMRTVSDRNMSCQYEWLDHAVPFCELPYDWNLDWWPNFMAGPTRYRVQDANYQYVNDQWRVLRRERTAAPASSTGTVITAHEVTYATKAKQPPKQK